MDAELVRWFAEHRVGWADTLAIVLTGGGYAGWIWIALAAVLARGERLRATALVAVGVWTSDLLALGLKAIVQRPRPYDALPGIDRVLGAAVSWSMPSGHAATSAAGALLVALAVRRHTPGLLDRPVLRGRGLVVALAVLALAICWSRVYLAAHYASDVLAGAGLGLVVGGAVAWFAARVGPRATGSARTATGSGPRSSGSTSPP